MDQAEGLLTFGSTNIALKVERLLKHAGVLCAVVPTPLEITAECGISLLLKEAWVEKAKEALAAAECDSFTLVFPFEH